VKIVLAAFELRLGSIIDSNNFLDLGSTKIRLQSASIFCGLPFAVRLTRCNYSAAKERNIRSLLNTHCVSKKLPLLNSL